MFTALDKNGKKVSIEFATKENKYFCETCGEQVAIKDGNIRQKHFSHFPNSNCSDKWNYDMSDWHRDWQNRFPLDSQEYIFKKGNEWHRADVFYKKNIIEFQHSPISKKEFDERNAFYVGLGYKVIWIFDFADDYKNGALRECKTGYYYQFNWRKPRSNFKNYYIKGNKNVTILFEIDYEIIGENEETNMPLFGPILIEITGSRDNFKRLQACYIDEETKRLLKLE